MSIPGMRIGPLLSVVLLMVGLAVGFGAGAALGSATVAATKTETSVIYQTVVQATTSTLTLREALTETAFKTTTTTTVVTTTSTATTTVNIPSVKETCFSRVERCDVLLISLINRANRSIYVAVYSFTRDLLATALISSMERGVEVRVVIERERAYEQGSEYPRLKSAGVDVRLDGNPNLMHHKFMVIDGYIVVTGSYNWSSAAEDRNDENIVVILDRDVAQRFVQEFERIWQTASP
jgi:phosphatidylserine/phosphatidylglycerophosphate/cardiolipin synthase-like enzyme